MIKRTLYFGNPCYLKKKLDQLVVDFKDEEKDTKSVPVEDIGIVVLDNPQITISQGLLAALSENNAAIINCDNRHMPFSLMLPTSVHHAYTEKLRFQLNASIPLKKNLWQQTVISKIANQAALLEKLSFDSARLRYLTGIVKSDDSENCEGRASSYYWRMLFYDNVAFRRHRFGGPPNNLLNYGYAVLRAVVARSLVASGLLTAVGIHHKNKYNPYCLADDIMEPFRPYVDELVYTLAGEDEDLEELTPDLKRRLLEIPARDIIIAGQRSPLMVGVQRTTASLMQCFEGESRKLVYPDL
ncbi:MAG: type II CRISPR-associated endonuclease Cas1 [Bacteroidales bacterium]|nr:type II CRISPR-associated endonuclease Cas1 [Bacteroidales bacterium]